MRKTTTRKAPLQPEQEQTLNAQQQRISAWITRLERSASELIEGTAIDDLSAKERLDLALKVMQQVQRFITLHQQLEVANQPTTQDNTSSMISDLMRQMRGEGSRQPTTTESDEPDNPDEPGEPTDDELEQTESWINDVLANEEPEQPEAWGRHRGGRRRRDDDAE